MWVICKLTLHRYLWQSYAYFIVTNHYIWWSTVLWYPILLTLVTQVILTPPVQWPTWWDITVWADDHSKYSLIYDLSTVLWCVITWLVILMHMSQSVSHVSNVWHILIYDTSLHGIRPSILLINAYSSILLLITVTVFTDCTAGDILYEYQ